MSTAQGNQNDAEIIQNQLICHPPTFRHYTTKEKQMAGIVGRSLGVCFEGILEGSRRACCLRQHRI